MSLSGVMELLFWNLYAVFYDSISILEPYKSMQEEILKSTFPGNALEQGISLLDAGCGTGNFLKLYAERFPDAVGNGNMITAIDASMIMMSRARTKCRNISVKWEIRDLNAPLPYENSVFDRIVCTNVLFALDNPSLTIAELMRVLKPGGLIVLATPRDHFDTDKILKKHLRGIKGIVEWLRFIPYLLPLGVATLLNRIVKMKARNKVYHFYDEKSIDSLFQDAGFSHISINLTYADQDLLVVAKKASMEPD